MRRERNCIVKKILLICAILLALTLAFAACDTSLPTETDNGDTTGAHEEVTAAPDTADPHESDTEAPTEPDTESDTFAPDGTDTQPETPTQPDTEESSPGETTPGETEPSEPEETGPGKLVFVSNDELRFLSNTGTQIGNAFDPGEYDSWTKRAITIGKDQVAVLVDYGWAAFDSRSYEFGYIVNGESFFSPGYAVSPEDAVVAAAKDKGAKNCSRFSGGLTAEVLKMGENTVQFCVKLDGDVLCVLREYTVTLTQTPVNLDGSYLSIPVEDWVISGHNPHVNDASNGMVAAGGVDKGALLHQGAVCVGEVDLSKYSKVVVYFGCDNSEVTQNHYNNNRNNRFMVTSADTNGQMSPDESIILAAETYVLPGWRVAAVEIDLANVFYKGPVYITVDALPGTFVLVSSIEFIGGEKGERPDQPDQPDEPDEPDEPDTPTPPSENQNYAPSPDDWTVSGHNPHIQDTSNGMVAAGGVEKGALLHQGAVCVGEVDLSKYSKVIVYYGCDNSQITIDHYNASANNRIMLSTVDTDGKTSPDEGDIIAAETYALRGWAVTAIEIDLTKVDYQGPVYISVDALPGTFMLISSIEFVA